MNPRSAIVLVWVLASAAGFLGWQMAITAWGREVAVVLLAGVLFALALFAGLYSILVAIHEELCRTAGGDR